MPRYIESQSLIDGLLNGAEFMANYPENTYTAAQVAGILKDIAQGIIDKKDDFKSLRLPF